MTLVTSVFEHINSNNEDIAIIDSDLNKYTYAKLYSEIQTISIQLDSAKLKKGSLLILNLDKSFNSLCFVLACLAKGIVYIPIDHKAPKERIEKIIEASNANGIVNPDLSINIFNTSLSAIDNNSACILYTSGSTGTPKGVICSSTGIMAFVNWANKEFSLTSDDTLTSFAPFHFDLSVFDIYSSLTSGAKLWLIDTTLSTNFRLLGQQARIVAPTIWYATPTVYTMLEQYGKFSTGYCPRLVLFAGEVFPIAKLNKVRQLWDTTYYNLYGPTETNVCTFYKLPSKIELNRTDIYPIGDNCLYSETRVQNGELLVSGESLMIGYHNNPNETNLKFLLENGKKWYKTGDLVNKSEEGLIYIGRSDRMIKRRGFRIELNELETALCNKDSVDNAAAIEIKKGDTNLIILYYSGSESSKIELTLHFNKHLPNYMIPDHFVYIKNIPISSNGKVNYNQLISTFNANG